MDAIILSQVFFWLLGIFGVSMLLVSAWYVTIFDPESSSAMNTIMNFIGAFVCPLVWIALVVVGVIWLSVALGLAAWISAIIAIVAILAYPFVFIAIGLALAFLYGAIVALYCLIRYHNAEE